MPMLPASLGVAEAPEFDAVVARSASFTGVEEDINHLVKHIIP